MTYTLLLQFAFSALISSVAIYVIVNTLIKMGLKNQQIPRFWIAVIMGFILTLPHIVVAALNIFQIVPVTTPANIFSTLTVYVFFFIPLIAMLRPFNYSLSAARMEVPLLFAITIVYFLYGLEGQPFNIQKIIPMGVIFLMFCYDIMRMLELGDYKIESKVKESKTKNYLTIFTFALIYGVAYLAFGLNENFFLAKENQTFYEILLQLSAGILWVLPLICTIIVWLRNNAPAELLVSSMIFSFVFTTSFLIPLVGFYVFLPCDPNLIFYTVTSLVGLGMLWFQITGLHYANRMIATILLGSFLFLIYSNH